MNNAAATTAANVRIGKGLSIHAQLRGIEGVAAMCGTVSRVFGAARRTAEAVTCEKCLAQIAADEAYEEEQAEAAHAALLLEDRANEIAAEVEARRSSIVAPVDTTATVTLAGTTTAFAKGDVVRTKDGAEWTVRRINSNGTVRLVNAEGTKVNRKPESLTR